MLSENQKLPYKSESFDSISLLQVLHHIEFIDTPADIRDKYQYFTEANMQKLIQAGYKQPFHSLEDGIRDYVCNYLAESKCE
jgi:ADP-L-glycero-D-manno-heptose 6-epimerase